MALYEIVPNISEGRRSDTIDAAVAVVEATGARVLHRTSDPIHHRSVLTIVGNERTVLDAAVALAGVAVETIDLREHRGVHPRIGALDVLPFVPLDGASLNDAAALAHAAGERIWERHGVPSFFYGAAARRPERVLLADVRRGEFEGLNERFESEAWRPDVGDIARHERAGAMAVGARELLIAFNVDLWSSDIDVARSIARDLRERSGGLISLRALGLRLGENVVQVSFNVTRYESTPLARIVELVRRLAASAGVTIKSSELIGCIPRAAVEAAARYYLGVSSTS